MPLENIFLEKPLYHPYKLNPSDSIDDLLSVLLHWNENEELNKNFTLDSYCTVCKKETTFISEPNMKLDGEIENIKTDTQKEINGKVDFIESNKIMIKHLEEIGIFTRIFKCPRNKNNNHDHVFVFKIFEGNILKIGQVPSMADLKSPSIQKYRKLNLDIYEELNRAVGLNSHGIGVGSFVYLRRIIEKHILYPKLTELIAQGNTTKDIIDKSSFVEKFKIAEAFLPKSLVNYPKIYSILSKGIHELEESECKDIFPILEKSIEIILDKKIEEIENKKKEIEISNKINGIH